MAAHRLIIKYFKGDVTMTVAEQRTIGEKEFGKKIEKYLSLKKNQTPDPEYCPTVYLLWLTQKSSQIKNIQTGKFVTDLDEKIRISKLPNWKSYWKRESQTNEYISKPNVNYYCRYIKPDYNLGIIEISSITIDTKRTNGPTAFKFLGSRVFMSMKDRKLWAYKEYTEPLRFIKPTDYVSRVPQCYYRDWYYTQFKLKTYLSDNKACANDRVRRELFKYLQANNVNSYFNGKSEVDISTIENFNIWNFCEWLTCKKASQKAIDKEALIKSLINAELPEIKLTREDLKIKGSEENTCYYGVVSYELWNGFDVFRFFAPSVKIKSQYSNYSYEQPIKGTCMGNTILNFDTLRWKETFRIFYKDKKIYILEARYNSKGFSYISAPNALGQTYTSYCRILDIDKIRNLDIFKYISGQIEEYPDDFTNYFIMTRKPITEQLIKINCPKIASEIMSENKVNANLRDCVGEVNAKKKTLKDVFGMTTKQLQAVEDYLKADSRGAYWSWNNFNLNDIGFLYELFTGKPCRSSKNDISNIDMETFKDALEVIQNLKQNNSLHVGWNWRYHRDTELKYSQTFSSLCPNDLEPEKRYKYIMKMMRMCKKANVGIQIISDNARMYNRLNDQFRPQNMRLEYNCPSDITRIHDALVEILAAQDAEQARINALKQDERNKELEKKMAKLDEKRKELEYEDDTYLIRLPKKLSELTVEGTVQRICIGGYVSSHAQGNANIYFLRKKSDPDKPFFAIEERNGQIIQIHGYGNKWLGADDDSFAAVPFVRRWLRANHLLCSTKILTSKARGYGCGNEFRELPAI